MNWNSLQRKSKETEEIGIEKNNNKHRPLSAYVLESMPDTFLDTMSFNPFSNSVR